MTESADSLNRDDIARSRARITQRVKYGHACAHERSRFLGRQFFWNQRQGFRRRDHVFGVTAVKIDAGHFAIHTHREIAAAAVIANKVMSAMPADADAVALFPIRDSVASKIDN